MRNKDKHNKDGEEKYEERKNKCKWMKWRKDEDGKINIETGGKKKQNIGGTR